MVDLQGREIARLADNEFAAGRHSLQFSPGEHASRPGLYFAVLQTGGRTFVRRFTVLYQKRKGSLFMRSVKMLTAALLASSLLVPALAHATCGAEGCPLVRDGFGASAKRFAFDLRFQDVTQDQLWSGTGKTDLAEVIAGAESHGEVELYTRTRSWVAEGRLRINDDLRVTATLPYIDREHRH